MRVDVVWDISTHPRSDSPSPSLKEAPPQVVAVSICEDLQ